MRQWCYSNVPLGAKDVDAPGSTSRAAADSRKDPALAGTTQIQVDEHTMCSMSEGSL